MNVVFIVPTGIGAEIGGHSGDATPAAKLISSVCDKLFVHPNIVYASDINEMTGNMLYVEGSILDRFLEGQVGLREIHSNKILLIVNSPIKPDTINAVSGARATLGADIEILVLDTPITMIAFMVDGKASGEIHGVDEAIQQVSNRDFDVLVVHTPIKTNNDEVEDYLSKDGGVNIWGGVEAKLSKLMSEKLNKPVIHAPANSDGICKTFNDVVDPRKAAEMVSICYLHCCLKGGHLAPRISMDDNYSYWNTDIDFLISPINVFGRPHITCCKHNIPVIVVKENKTILNDKMPDDFIVVENYLEAVGVISAKKAGITIESVRRPLGKTNVFK